MDSGGTLEVHSRKQQVQRPPLPLGNGGMLAPAGSVTSPVACMHLEQVVAGFLSLWAPVSTSLQWASGCTHSVPRSKWLLLEGQK